MIDFGPSEQWPIAKQFTPDEWRLILDALRYYRQVVHPTNSATRDLDRIIAELTSA